MIRKYAGVLIWIMVFTAGIFLLPMFDLPRKPAVSLLLNYSVWMLVILLGVMHITGAVHWFSGVTLEEAERMSESEKKEMTGSALRTMVYFGCLFSLYSLASYFLSLPFYADITVFTAGLLFTVFRMMISSGGK